jgi:hypothetical protein
LCRRSFLNLWSWPNVYRNKTWGAGEEGKELCDLLFVFGDHVVIFSVKECAFPNSGDPDLDWSRWFRKTIWKSANQIWGAERWLRENPGRVFRDSSCKVPLPFRLPDSDDAKFVRVVVAHGSGIRARKRLGGSGSLIMMPDIIGKQHFKKDCGPVRPFAIGQLDVNRGYVHVLDDTSFEILLQTLDTAPDFIQYLDRKERLIESGRLGIAAGEEDLLAFYLQHVDDSEHHEFVFPKRADRIIIDEGFWTTFQSHPDRLAQIQANRDSYVWDRLIETFSSSLLENRTDYRSHADIRDLETALRILARENRTVRRMLSKAFIGNLKRGSHSQRGSRPVKWCTKALCVIHDDHAESGSDSGRTSLRVGG